MITMKSVAHFCAKAWQAIKRDAPKVGAALNQAQATKGLVEGGTALAGHAELIPVEEAAYASLGALSAFLIAGGDAAEQNLLNLGFDKVAVDKAKDLHASNQTLVAIAKAL